MTKWSEEKRRCSLCTAELECRPCDCRPGCDRMKMVCPAPGCGFIDIETREDLERSRTRLPFLPMSLFE